MRTDPAAEEEIRSVFDQIARICVDQAPALFHDFQEAMTVPGHRETSRSDVIQGIDVRIGQPTRRTLLCPSYAVKCEADRRPDLAPALETMSSNSTPPPALVRELRREVRKALRAQGFQLKGDLIVPPDPESKDALRALHTSAVAHRRHRAREGLRRHENALIRRLAHNDELNVTAMEPELVTVRRGTQDELLFRWAALHWSIPVSSGYGRRLRCLVIDRSNGKLVGLIGLGDPVFALAARDTWIGWDRATRGHHLHHLADAFVLGAVPPYNSLLGGKLVAALAASDEVRAAWRNRYGGRTSLIAAQERDGRLAMLTTTSALGRSSISQPPRVRAGTHVSPSRRNPGVG